MGEKREERVRLGVVDVDSGQLVVVDPCYIDSEWPRSDEVDVVGVDFWGLDEEAVAGRLIGDPAVGAIARPRGHSGVYRVTPAEGATPDDVARAVQRARRPGEVVVVAEHTASGYDKVGDVTLGYHFQENGGQIEYAAGRPGLAVAFPSGYGDGTYEVFATIRDCGPWGRRVARVEIILVEDDDDEVDEEGLAEGDDPQIETPLRLAEDDE